MSDIDTKYAALGGSGGWLGAPTTAEQVCPDGIGHYRHYQHGSIYWSPATHAHEVHGLIRDKWAKLGWEKSPLGYPTSDETASPSGKGRYSAFQGGAILWQTGAPEAFESHGAIRGHWGVFGYENGWLGFPLTDESKTPDQVGRYNHFQGGSIYWKPSIGAHEAHGDIRAYWAAHGWERNAALGYPISDEQSHGTNRYSDFENGVLFWHRSNSTTNELVPTTLLGASKSRAEMEAMLAKTIGDQLKAANSRVYLENGPRIESISDYSFDGANVHNRQYVVYTKIGYDVSGLPDPESDITLNIRVELDRARSAVTATIGQWNVHTHVPWPTSWGQSASGINAQLKAHIDPLVGVPQIVQVIPQGSLGLILAMKVMPNGDFNTYIQL